MSNVHYIPKGIREFRDWAKNFDTVLASILEQLGIPAAAYKTLEDVKKIWEAADAAAENVVTATKAALHERTRMMEVYTKAIRVFVAEYVSHNHLLTPQQREELGLSPIKPSSPQPPPTKRPNVKITTEAPGQVNVHCSGEDTQWGMEEGVHGYEWGYVISDTKPETYEELTESEFSTRAHHSKVFGPKQRAKKLYSAFRWENEKGEKGPWTDFYETIIP
jgi:hypothetical protein